MRCRLKNISHSDLNDYTMITMITGCATLCHYTFARVLYPRPDNHGARGISSRRQQATATRNQGAVTTEKMIADQWGLTRL